MLSNLELILLASYKSTRKDLSSNLFDAIYNKLLKPLNKNSLIF